MKLHSIQFKKVILLAAAAGLSAAGTALAEPTPTKRIHWPIFAPELAGEYRTAHQQLSGEGYQSFDKMEFEVGEQITEIIWYGSYMPDFDGPRPVAPPPAAPGTDDWQISFRTDSGGVPGGNLFSVTIPANEVDSTEVDMAIFDGPTQRYRFSYTFETPVEIAGGTPFWLSVLSKSDTEGSVFIHSSGSAGAITATGHAELAALDLRNARGTRQTGFTNGHVDTGSGGARAFTLLTLPLNDSDQDGMDDNWEDANGLVTDLDDSMLDPDSDGLTNLIEFERGTNPQAADSDGDGLDDKVESGTGLYLDEADRGTSPNHVDSDGDGLNDNVEVPSQATLGPDQPGTHPLMPDSDRDGLGDLEEINLGTDPNNRDTDGDRASDNWEVLNGTNPKDPGSPLSVDKSPLGSPSQTWNSLGLFPTFNGFMGGADKRDATFRALIDFDAKPDGNRELIWETGGGRIGFSLTYEAGDTLVLRAVGQSGTNMALIRGALRQEWIDAGELEVVWSYDVQNAEGTQTVSLWVDGHPISEVRADLGGDWSGANDASIGIGNTLFAATGVGSVNLTGDALTSGSINLATGVQYFPSVPSITAIQHPLPKIKRIEVLDANRISLEWSSRPDITYSLQESSDLKTWLEVEDSIPATGFLSSWASSAENPPLSNRAYYRIVETP